MVARTLLFVAGGAVLMVGVGRLYALTTATCSTICKVEVAAPLGAVVGLMVALMVRSGGWRPLEEEEPPA